MDRRLPDWPERVRALVPDGVDVAFDSAGADWDAVLSTLRPAGRLVVFGARMDDFGRLGKVVIEMAS